MTTAKRPRLHSILTAKTHAMGLSIAKNTTIHIRQVRMTAMSMNISSVKNTTHIVQLSKLAMIMSTSITAMPSSNLYTLWIHTTAMTMSMNMTMTMGRLRSQKRTAMLSYSTTTIIAAMNHMSRRRRLQPNRLRNSLSQSHYLMRITRSMTSAATVVKNTRWKMAQTI